MSHPSDRRTTPALSRPTRSLKLSQALASGSALALAVTLALNAGAIEAKTVRIGNQGDALSMDPHSLNESLQLSVMSNVYE